jgi:hypothetical protein
LVHYANIMLHPFCCLRFIWYMQGTSRLGSWLYCRLRFLLFHILILRAKFWVEPGYKLLFPPFYVALSGTIKFLPCVSETAGIAQSVKWLGHGLDDQGSIPGGD